MNVLDKFTSLPQGRGKVYLEWVSSKGGSLADNPEARNAMSVAMMHQLEPIVNELEEKKAQCCCNSWS